MAKLSSDEMRRSMFQPVITHCILHSGCYDLYLQNNMILLSKSTTLTLSALTLTNGSILSDGGTCKCSLLKYFFFSSSRILNFATFKRSRNSRNKSHANIKCFTYGWFNCRCAQAMHLCIPRHTTFSTKPFDNSHSICCHLAIGAGTKILPVQ